MPYMSLMKPQKKKPVANAPKKKKEETQVRSLRRKRTQAVLFQLVDAASIKPAKRRKIGKKSVKKIEENKKKSKTSKPKPKSLKNVKGKLKDSNRKVKTGRIVKKNPKEPKVKAKPKKGNDKLIPRTGVPQYEDNPFMEKPDEDQISNKNLHRLVIRHILKKNTKALESMFKSNKINVNNLNKTFSNDVELTPEMAAVLTGDSKFIEKFYKMRKQLKNDKFVGDEANLLYQKQTGKSSYYMLGRHTRGVEMTRGGKEGNNAFLKYEGKNKRLHSACYELLEQNVPYEVLHQLTKMQDSPVNVHYLSSGVVRAARMGNLSLASKIAEAEAKDNFNDLHRFTLKGGALPARILPVSLAKKGFNNGNITPIHTAAINGDIKILGRLSEIDPNVNIPDKDNWYTVHYAAVSESPKPLEYILKTGAPINLLTKNMESPLHCAVKAGRVHNVKILLEQIAKNEQDIKADKSLVNMRTRGGDTPLMVAIRYERIDVIETLLSFPSILPDLPSSVSQMKRTALMLACSLGSKNIVRMLIEKNCLIEGKDQKKRTPLMHACLNGQTHIVAHLLALGANLKAVDSSYNSAAHYAAAYGFTDCVIMLADVDPTVLTMENDWKISPFSVAYLKGHYRLVSVLLNEKYKSYVNINGKDSDGVTLLSSILRYSEDTSGDVLYKQLEFLINKGADCCLPDGRGNTPLHDFVNLKFPLSLSGKNNDSSLQDYMKCCELLIEKGASLSVRNDKGLTPFHMVCENGNFHILNWLLKSFPSDSQLFLTNWADDHAFFHDLFKSPLVTFKSHISMVDYSFDHTYYDVMQIIDTLSDKFGSEFQVLKELNKTNKDGLTPLVEMMRSIKEGSWASHSKPNFVEKFIDFINDQVVKIIKLDRSAILKQFEYKTENSAISIKTSVLKIALEIKHNNGLPLFKKIICNSKPFLKTANPWSIKVGEVPILIAAIQISEMAVNILLENFDYQENDPNFLELFDFPDVVDPKIILKKNALMMMIERGMLVEVIKLPLTSEVFTPCDTEGNNLAHYIAARNHPQSVELLQKLNAKNFLTQNNLGETPLHKSVVACTTGRNPLLDALEYFSANISVETPDNEGRTALHYAFGTRESFDDISLLTKRDPIAIVSILTAKSSQQLMEQKDTYGNSVLHLAAYCDSNVCAVSLLRKGALIDDENGDENTPLGVAVSRGNKTVALALLQANADVHRKVLLEDPSDGEETGWLWTGDVDEKKHSETNSSIIREVIKREKEWESMVYVMIDVIGNDLNAFNQLVECCLQFKQYTLANQLLKSIELRSSNDPYKDEHRLFEQYARYHPGYMKKGEIDDIVFDRLLRIGAVLINENVCIPLELALRNGNFSLYKRIKEEIGEKEFSMLKPSSQYGGPLKEIIQALSKSLDWEGKFILKQILKIKKISSDDSLDLPLLKHLKSEMIDGPFTALGWACLHDFKDLVALLRELNFDCNVADIHGRTPMMMIALTNSSSAFEALFCEKKEKVVVQKQKVVANRNNIFSMAAPSHHDVGGDFAPNAFGRNSDSESGSVSSFSHSSSHHNDEEDDDEEEENNTPPEETYSVHINNKKFSISAKDKNDKTVFHYFVEPYAWENVDLFKTIMTHFGNDAKTVLAEADKNGKTPASICKESIQRKMYKAIQKYLSVATEKITATLPTVSFNCPYNIDELAEKFMSQCSENDETAPVDDRKPNEQSGFSETGVIVECPETGEPMKVLMNKTDVGYGRFGFHNFYRLELIKRKDTDLYILFTNWGRIGAGEGEHQITPYGTLELGVKEFKSVFKSKMGQDWKQLSEIEVLPKRYRLIQKVENVKTIADIEIPAYTENTSERSEEDQFIADVTDVKLLKTYTKNGSQLRNLPYGRIDRDSLQKARDVLSQCASLSKAILGDSQATTVLHENKSYTVLEAYQLMNDLSSEFYALLRPGSFESSMLPRFDNQSEIRKAFDLIRRLTEVEAATRLLVASLSYPEIDRLTFVRQSLSCEFKMLSENDQISQHILHWISSSSCGHPIIKGIMSVLPEKPLKNFAQFSNEEKQIFLLHGTKPTNLISILENGLQSNPVFASRTGQIFGEGVYLADTFEKSKSYCSPSSRGVNYMLVCQVALGDVLEEISTSDIFYRSEMKDFKDTRIVRGSHYPSSSLTVDGVPMPLGHVKVNRKRLLQQTEYIVRNGERILPRFLILFQ